MYERTYTRNSQTVTPGDTRCAGHMSSGSGRFRWSHSSFASPVFAVHCRGGGIRFGFQTRNRDSNCVGNGQKRVRPRRVCKRTRDARTRAVRREKARRVIGAPHARAYRVYAVVVAHAPNGAASVRIFIIATVVIGSWSPRCEISIFASAGNVCQVPDCAAASAFSTTVITCTLIRSGLDRKRLFFFFFFSSNNLGAYNIRVMSESAL